MIVRLKLLQQAKRQPPSFFPQITAPPHALSLSRRSMPSYRHRDRMAASPLKVSIAK
jgi:hypothetical protein